MREGKKSEGGEVCSREVSEGVGERDGWRGGGKRRRCKGKEREAKVWGRNGQDEKGEEEGGVGLERAVEGGGGNQ